MQDAAAANLDVKAKFQKAVFAGDFAGALPFVDPEFSLVEPDSLPYGGVYRGLEAFKRALQAIRASFQNTGQDHVASYFTDDPDRHIVEMQVRGKLVATGQAIESRVFELWEFRNGKVLRITPCWLDTAAFQAA
jgi:ketosteroid isomerase-like protein